MLGHLQGSDFEAVDVSSLMIDPNSDRPSQSTTVTVTVSPVLRHRRGQRHPAVHRHRDQRYYANCRLECQWRFRGNSTVG